MNFNWTEFKDGKIVAWCDTENKAKDFIKQCYKLGIEWGSHDKNYTNYEDEGKETCYCCDFVGDGKLGYSSKRFYEDEGYRVVKWESGEMEFKVGDRVEVINNEKSETFYNVGDKGTVMKVWTTEMRIKFDTPKSFDGIWVVHNKNVKKIDNAKFKVGDKVKVKKNLITDEYYGGYLFVEEMKRYENEIVTIDTECFGDYLITGDENGCWWTNEMLEELPSVPLDDESKFKVGDKVTIIDKDYYGYGEELEVVEVDESELDGYKYRLKSLSGFDKEYIEDIEWDEEDLKELVINNEEGINKMEFKVGDKVKAIDNNYGTTNKDNNYVGEVIELYGENGLVLKTIFNNDKEDKSKEHAVNARHFELFEEPVESIGITFEELLKLKDNKVYININESNNVKTIRISEEGRIEITYANENTMGVTIPANCKFKLKETKKRVTVYEIEYEQGGQRHGFISSQRLQENLFVVCDTPGGKYYGLITGSNDKELTEEEIEQYRECWRA